MGLEDVLGQIQADGANLCHGRLPLVALNATILARQCRRGGRPPHHYKTTTITAALRSDGLCATSLFDGATNGARFRTYITDTLVPVLKP